MYQDEDENEPEDEFLSSFRIKTVTNEPGPQYYDTLKDRFVRHAQLPERTKSVVFVFVFVFVLAHEQAISTCAYSLFMFCLSGWIKKPDFFKGSVSKHALGMMAAVNRVVFGQKHHLSCPDRRKNILSFKLSSAGGTHLQFFISHPHLLNRNMQES